MQKIANFLIKQWRATRIARTVLISCALAAMLWFSRWSYHEWQTMRVVAVITQELRQIIPQKNQHLPMDVEDTRV